MYNFCTLLIRTFYQMGQSLVSTSPILPLLDNMLVTNTSIYILLVGNTYIVLSANWLIGFVERCHEIIYFCRKLSIFRRLQIRSHFRQEFKIMFALFQQLACLSSLNFFLTSDTSVHRQLNPAFNEFNPNFPLHNHIPRNMLKRFSYYNSCRLKFF